MAKFKNLIFAVLLVLLFVEVLIVFPKKLEHDDDAKVQARVELQEKRKKELEEQGKDPKEKQSTAEQKMGGVHLVESQKGQRDWELFSESAEGSQGSGNWKLKKVRVFFYNKEKVEFTATGDEGTIDSNSKDLNIKGNVVTRSENGYVFKTPGISYSAVKRLIESPEDVYMEGPRDKTGAGMVLKGRSMQVLVDQSKMLIKEKVTATKPMNDGKRFEVVADGAEFSGKSNLARFLGSVRMNYDGMRLEGPEASFLYDKGANLLSSISVLGGVKVSDADKFATADVVNLDLLANKYVFKGKPKVIQNNDELSGEEIIFLEGGKKVKVERVRAKMENKDK
ncbi:LPS export ABC transporter periplasmic protein LptC [Bdellovibrio sp. ZAP7]|uniref:LPS export ABC transporter periplasmic protein LptC n=1 Tax=Bdellovibrio sp. ZAP7 TaxID=2231053 RepID=UPI00115ACB5C|nr:LPS export ABC transporter periplasmic protein LptC [Bdellovibrio sp. ZAP7]QDK46581.1 LPS export ABC transporter periplasmic protein LptC [Bdellovibrio sp. ZAP7]